MSHLKTQIMTMFMIKSNSNNGTGQNDIYLILYSILFMNIVEYMFQQAPQITAFLKTIVMANMMPKKENWMPLLNKTSKEKEQMNSVSMTRVFATNSDKPEKVDNMYVEMVDAVVDYLCSLDNAKHVKIDTRYSLNSTEEIELTPLLKARVKETGNSEETSMLEIVIFSKILKVSEIRQWIDEVHSNYVFEKNNKLGNRIYYFNEVPIEPIVQCEMDSNGGPPKQSYRWENMPKMLTFHMNEFKTSKSFNNIYGNHIDELKERLDLFINHPDWYMERGIPHSLGIMLHGVPGAGKTSTIKAIAKDTHRHIFNLSLRPYTSQRQLTNLFFNETVVVYGNEGAKQTLKIPMNRRVYVIEDIDCLTDVVVDRAITGGKNNRVEGDALTLSFLLNLLDGVLETPGRILVITSNYPQKIDRALVRPGRIDVQIEFTNANRNFILDMINKFYSIQYELEQIPIELDNIFTPAEVMESMCMHFKKPDLAIDHMVNKIQAKRSAKEAEKGTSLNLLEYQYPPSDELEKPVVVEPEIKDTIEIVTHILEKPSAKKLDLQQVEYGWASADFSDAEFLPGGMMPGEGAGCIRSEVDLNLSLQRE